MSFKLTARQRLRDEEDFVRLLKRGNKLRNDFFFIPIAATASPTAASPFPSAVK